MVRVAVVALLFGGLTVAYFATRSGGVEPSSLAQNNLSGTLPVDVSPARTPSASATDLGQARGPGSTIPSAPSSRGGRNDLLNENLAQLFQQALEAKNPDERALAFWVGSHCSGFAFSEANSPITETDMMTLFGVNAKADQVKKLMERRVAARSRMKGLCSTGDAEGFFDSLLKLKKPGELSTGMIMTRIEVPNSADALYRQQHVQALTQLLASPSQYPAQFERWLDSQGFSKVVRSIGAPTGAVSFIGDSLMVRFGLEHMLNYRRTRLCFGSFRCFDVTELSQAQQAAVEAAADQIETLIRTQRWDVLLAQGD